MYKFSRELFLASKSPRRHELLKRFGIEYNSIESDSNEPTFNDLEPDLEPSEVAMQTAKFKTKSCTNKTDNSIIMGFDTIVYNDNKVLGKPTNEDEAFTMLNSLSGKTHQVFTGVALRLIPEDKISLFYEKTDVAFRVLADKEIKNYILSGEPFDKAGAYGIQGKGGVFVSRISGCYFNVVGLPVNTLLENLKLYINNYE